MLTAIRKSKNVPNKLSNFLHITIIVNQVLQASDAHKQTRLRIYNTVAVPTLLHGSETWIVKEEDRSRITALHMKYSRKTANHALFGHKINQDIMKEIKIQTFLEKINNYTYRWIEDIRWMDRSQFPYDIMETTSRKEEPRWPTEETCWL
jgi:hypothetical protein